MKNRRTNDLRDRFKKLPKRVQEQAKAAYLLFEKNPYYPGLYFKRLNTHDPLYSARVGDHYRVVGLRVGDTIYGDFT